MENSLGKLGLTFHFLLFTYSNRCESGVDDKSKAVVLVQLSASSLLLPRLEDK